MAADGVPPASVSAATGAEPRPPLGVAFDGDLSARPDALLAIAMLNGLTAKGDARRISLSVSRPSLTAARLADVLAELYATLPQGAGYLTVGMAEGPVPREDAPALGRALSATSPDGAPLFEARVKRVADTADNATLIRNMLLAQHDGNAVVVLAGPATGLARLLALHGAREQIAAKVQRLVVALGAYPSGKADASIAADVAAARQLFADWPTPIVAAGAEVGDAVRYPAAKLEEGLAWSSAHPIAAACRAIAGLDRDLPTTALAAMLHAVHPEAGDFRLSAPGTIEVLDDGRTRFVPGTSGRHRHLGVDAGQRGRLLATYMSLVTAQPAPRPVRRPPPMAAAPNAAASSGPAAAPASATPAAGAKP